MGTTLERFVRKHKLGLRLSITTEKTRLYRNRALKREATVTYSCDILPPYGGWNTVHVRRGNECCLLNPSYGATEAEARARCIEKIRGATLICRGSMPQLSFIVPYDLE